MNFTTTSLNSLKMFESRERYLTHYLLSNIKGIKSFYMTEARVFYDAVAISEKDQTILIEVKVRDNTIDRYPDYFLEVDKLNNLADTAKRLGHKILYINYFKTDDPGKWDFIIFNLNKRFDEWPIKGVPNVQYIPMNERTFVSSDKKVSKWVIKLKYEPDKDKKGTFYYTLN